MPVSDFFVRGMISLQVAGKTHVLVSDFSRPENYFVTSCRNNAGARRKCQTNYSFFPFFQHYSVLASINIGSLTYSIILGK